MYVELGYCIDLCVVWDWLVLFNLQGVVVGCILGGCCVCVCYRGLCENIFVVYEFYGEWLFVSGEWLCDVLFFFYYVNVGLDVVDYEMLIDIYLLIVD